METSIVQRVPSVDVKKYMGKWHEIASFSQCFQKDCLCTQLNTLSEKGYVIVENRSNK